ncbi:MAG: hypothetical protein U0167_19890 [bacterium]
MSFARTVALLIVIAMLALPGVPGADRPTGGMNWICLAYGALAGASLMTGSVVGAVSLCLSAARSGCFG